MEILPRIKPTLKQASPRTVAPPPPIVTRAPVADVVIDIDDDEDDEDKMSDPVKSGRRSVIRDNYIIIIIFASIVVFLIILVCWLVVRNDKYLNWLRGVKPPPPDPKPQSKSSNMSHINIAKNSSNDELEMFANMDVGKSVSVDNDASTSAVVEEENDDDDDMILDDKSDKKHVQFKEPIEAPAFVPKQYNNDDTIEKQLNAKLSDIAEEKSDTDTGDVSAIEEIVDAEVANIEADQHKHIEQIQPSSGLVVNTFVSSDAIYNAGFDYDSVVSCCKGIAQTHKKHKWRFVETK